MRYTPRMALQDLTFRDIDWIVSIRSIRSLRDFARLKRVQVAQVSKVFKKIENHLGVTLFVRSSKGIELTEEAQALVHECEAIQERLQALQKFARGPDSRETVITLASFAFLQQFLGLDVLPKVELPQTTLRLIETNPANLNQFQLLSEIDIVLHLGAIDWPGSLKSIEVGTLHYRFYIGSAFYRKDLRLKDLYRLPFIAPTYFEGGKITFGSDRCPIPVGSRIRGDGTSTAAQAIHLIQRREQIAFLPEISAREAVRQGKIRALESSDLPRLSETLWMSVKTGQVKQKTCRALEEALRQQLGQVTV